MIDEDAELIIVGGPDQAREARVRLARVGLDSVVGALDQPTLAFAQRPDAVEVASRITAPQLAEAVVSVPHLVMLDVRGSGERAAGWIDGSARIPITELRGGPVN